MFKKLRAFWELRRAQSLSDNNPQAALNSFQKILTICPEYDFGHYHFARYWVMQEDYAQAQKSIQTALSLQAKNPIYHHYFGVILYHQKKYVEAMHSFRKSLEIAPQNCLTQNYIALVHIAKGDIEEGKKILQTVGLFESDDIQMELLMSLEGLSTHPKKNKHSKRDS